MHRPNHILAQGLGIGVNAAACIQGTASPVMSLHSCGTEIGSLSIALKGFTSCKGPSLHSHWPLQYRHLAACLIGKAPADWVLKAIQHP